MSEVDTRAQQGVEGKSRGPRLVSSPAELAAAREARGMSQFDVSQRIKLQVRQVAALEEGNWDLLPGRAFARGALRSYGKLIQVDVTPLLEVIGTADAMAQMPRHALSSGVGPATDSVYERQGRGGTLLWVIGGLVAAGALIFYFGSGPGGMFNRDAGPLATTATPSGPTTATGAVAAAPVTGGAATSETPAAPTGSVAGSVAGITSLPAAAPAAVGTVAGAGAAPGQPSTGPVAGPDLTAPVPAAASAASSMAAGGGGASADPAPASTAAASTAASSTAASDAAAASAAHSAAATSAVPAAGAGATPSAVAATPGTLVFQPVEDSWVRVIDSTGKKVHEALIPAGTTVTVDGKPPYKLRMGNARHLKVHYQGREVKVPSPNEKNITVLELP